MEITLDKLLDNRNINLWESIQSTHKIELALSNEPNYMTRFLGDSITIYIQSNNYCPAAFTHELLHVYLKLQKVNIALDLENKIAESEKLFYLFSKDLKEHIGNCLEHTKMLPLYLRMGFDNRLFISDFSEKKINKDIIRNIEMLYKQSNIYNREAIDIFIGKFFAMRACNNTSHNYLKYYKLLEKVDPKLYRLLSDFWNDWSSYDISDSDDNYQEILEYFIEDLNAWIKNKIVL